MRKFVVFAVMGLALMLAADSQAVLILGTPANTGIGGPNATPAPLFGTLWDFDEKAGPVLASDGVSFGVASTTGLVGTFSRFSGTQSAPFYVGTGPSAGWDGAIRFEFFGLASMVGIGIADSVGVDTVTVRDSALNILETYTVPSGLNVYVIIDRLGSHDIKYFDISGDFFAIDDLQHNAPEPGTLLLLGAGLIGIIGTVRHKRS